MNIHTRLSLKPVYVNPVDEFAEEVKGRQLHWRGQNNDKRNDVQ